MPKSEINKEDVRSEILYGLFILGNSRSCQTVYWEANMMRNTLKQNSRMSFQVKTIGRNCQIQMSSLMVMKSNQTPQEVKIMAKVEFRGNQKPTNLREKHIILGLEQRTSGSMLALHAPGLILL